MSLTIVQRGDPGNVDDLPRNFRPIEMREFEVGTTEAFTLGITPPTISGRHRVIVVYAVSTVDANKMVHLGKYVGPATGRSGVTILLGGEDDWGHAQDIMEARVETVRRREIESAVRRSELQTRINTELPDIADDMTKQKLGHSTFGPGGHKQRVS